MRKTIVVVGYGPGISSAVAEKFGTSGYAVAIVGRNADKLATGVKSLEAKGISARAFTAEAGKPESIRDAIAAISKSFGPIAALEWTAYGNDGKDFLTADSATFHSSFDVAVVGLMAAVQVALPDLRATKGSVLITNGAFGEPNPKIDAMAVQYKSAGLAIANAAKGKLAGLLAVALEPEGVFVGEVTVAGIVKGSGSDRGGATVEPSTVANTFWDMHVERKETRARVIG